MPSNTMKAAIAGLAAALSAPVSAFWRMPCPARLVLERIDPLISPGVTSGHVHTVSGGSGFGYTTNYAQQRASACSSCPIQDDLSAYWTPKLYWMSEDGKTFRDVKQSGEGGAVTGGMTVYYEQRGPDLTALKAFPEGFRMIAGDPFQRNYTDVQAAPGNAVSFVCLNYAQGSSQHNEMPNKKCPDGLRAQVYFPSCWNGELDSEDHKSHMAYPIGHYDDGKCPEKHPHQLISIFYEVIYNTAEFDDDWWSTETHPFVFAQGDRTGYGFHGDFVNGWNVDVLQQAVDECLDDSGLISDCHVFDDKLFTDDQCQACRIPNQVHEQITGNLTKLPGCNSPTDGPAYAPPQTCDNSVVGAAEQFFTDVTGSLGWEYVGCGVDSTGERTLQGADTSSDDMTVQTCIKYCKDQGYSLAGLEYASQCYCDNNYHGDDTAPEANILGTCWQPCVGNAAQVCGGSDSLSIYKACDGGVCTNDVFKVNGTTTSSTTNSSKHRRHINRHRGHARL